MIPDHRDALQICNSFVRYLSTYIHVQSVLEQSLTVSHRTAKNVCPIPFGFSFKKNHESKLPSFAASYIVWSGVLAHAERRDISYCPLLPRVPKGAKKNRLKDINRWGNSSNSAFPLRVSDASFSLGSCLELFSAQPWIRCVRSQSRTPFTAQWLAIHHLHSHRAAKPRPIPKRTNQRARSGRIRNMVSLRVRRVSEKFSWETNAFTKTYSESCLTRWRRSKVFKMLTLLSFFTD